MQNLTIKITEIRDGKEKGFRAVVKELGDSIVYGDTIGDIFKVMPEVIKSAKQHKIGIFGKSVSVRQKQLKINK